MAGVNNNLIPGDQRTHESNAENGRRGGIASGAAKRRKKATRDLIRLVLDSPVDVTGKSKKARDAREALRKVGYDVDERGLPTVETIMSLQIATQAMAGDLSSAQFLYSYAQIPDMRATLERERIKASGKSPKAADLNDVEDLTSLARLLEGDAAASAPPEVQP